MKQALEQNLQYGQTTLPLIQLAPASGQEVQESNHCRRIKNEKIDIVRYSLDPVEYIVNALSPARIISVDILADEETRKEAFVIVPDDQLSLAIGREGQNVRLAHRLTGWKIDIKSESQAAQMEKQGSY